MVASARSFSLPLRSHQRRTHPGAGSAGAEISGTPGQFDVEVEPFRRGFVAALRQVSRPSAALVFVSGAPTQVAVVAQMVAESARGLSAIVVPASGILTEQAEIEGVAAVSGIIWSSGGASVAGSSTAAAVTSALPKGGTLVAFCGAEGFEAGDIAELARNPSCTFGAGSPGGALHVVTKGEVSAGRLAAMQLEGVAPIVETTAACRLVSEPMRVTHMDHTLLSRLDDTPALDLLGAKAGGGRHGGLILVAIHDPGDPSRYLIRPLRGIDPQKRAISVAADLVVGDHVSFAVRDPAAARESLSEAARRAESQVIGSSPTFALFLSCAGRGRALYGEPDVDIRILKKRFPKIPIAGMHSAFEIVPWADGSARMQLMSGVLALFRAPS